MRQRRQQVAPEVIGAQQMGSAWWHKRRSAGVARIAGKQQWRRQRRRQGQAQRQPAQAAPGDDLGLRHVTAPGLDARRGSSLA